MKLRVGLYVLVAIGSVVAIWAVPDTAEGRASAVVQALATISLAAVAVEALLYSRALVSVTRQYTDATEKQVGATRLAVEAAEAATVEARRQALLGSLPFLRVDRPSVGNDPADQGLVIEVPVRNLGPGPALEVGLRLEIQDEPAAPWRDYNQGAWGEALLDDEEGAFATLSIKAQDLLNTKYRDWRRLVETEYGIGESKLPADLLVPKAIRVHVAWLSVRGVRAEEVYLWRTEDVTMVHRWTWQFESLTYDLGQGNGAPLTFAMPR